VYIAFCHDEDIDVFAILKATDRYSRSRIYLFHLTILVAVIFRITQLCDIDLGCGPRLPILPDDGFPIFVLFIHVAISVGFVDLLVFDRHEGCIRIILVLRCPADIFCFPLRSAELVLQPPVI
jgi:hypothetical protein